MLRSLWRRPNLDHDVENPLRISTAPEVDSRDLEPDLPESGDFIREPPIPNSLDRPSRLPISLSDDSGLYGFDLALPTPPYRYQPPQLCDLVYELRKVDWHQLGV